MDCQWVKSWFTSNPEIDNEAIQYDDNYHDLREEIRRLR